MKTSVLRKMVVSFAVLVVMILFSACAGVGSNGQSTLSGSIVSVNASTHTVVLNVNGQQDTITNVPDNVIQLLQGQVGKMYGVQVTQNSDGSFSIVGGTNVTPENNQGTPETTETPSSSNETNTPETGTPAQGTIKFNGNVQSSGTNSLVVSLPGGGTLSVSTNGSTDLGDFNNSLPAVNTQVKVTANANTDGSYTATKISKADSSSDDLNTITFQGRTTAAVGSDNVIHFTVGAKSYNFTIPSTAKVSDFSNAQSIQSGTQVEVQVQYNGSTPTVIKVGMASS
ncbi:MAG TPA: DUF5666 domain-containing protein [Ktedonobacteraceae bacterium]|nr:DUF5666 domain-containing protein [Ktedonobacteraceae bacterium]